MQTKWELFSHKADMGIRGIGPSFEAAFEQAGLALTGVLMNPDQIKAHKQVSISFSAPQMDILFFDWINALIYEMAHDNFIFGKFRVSISKNKKEGLTLRGLAWGESIDPTKHELAVEIKGATFTELKAEESENGLYLVQCIVDV